MNSLAQATSERLSRAIATAPGAMSELLARYGCEVPASPEALAMMAAAKGEAFTDDLFIVLGQAERVSGRYAGATGATAATAPTSDQRSALGRGLASIMDFVKRQITVTTAGSADGVDYTATNDPSKVVASPRVLGLSQPMFVFGLLVLILAAVALLVHHRGK